MKYCVVFLVCQFLAGMALAQQQAREVLQTHCLHCHDEQEKSGGVDLSHILQPHAADDPQASRLWTRVEKMVAAGKMPPAEEERLSDQARQSIVQWYRSEFILRAGKDHIGATPLRRLTRYELENTLEDLLHIRLKRPYVVSIESQALLPSTIEELYPADTPGESGFDNDAEQLHNVPVPVVPLFACVDYALRKFEQTPAARREIWGSEEIKIDPQQGREILNRFADRAARGYANEAERRQILAVYDDALKQEAPRLALLRGMKTVLLSPSFLYRLEESRENSEPYPVSGPELAVRLSYFLWGTMPDESLFQAAADGSLSTDEGLKQQIARMLNDPRRVSLAENFAGQWLGFDELKRNKVFYRDEKWTRGVYDELLFGFDELIKSDRSILEIVDSDWLYLRQDGIGKLKTAPPKHAAKYADIFAARRDRTGLKVEQFYNPPRLYQIESDRLGGMITSAGILRLTSAPTRTNPIRRGVWLLENLIGEEMQPPENIPPLAEAEKKLAAEKGNRGAISPREILKLHTSRQSCQACHQHIDPLGLGLENFSPYGDWRDEYQKNEPIESTGVLPNGKEFSSPQELKRELLAYYKPQIVETTIRKMLSYAIGRKLQPYDRVALERIAAELEKNDYKMGVLIEQIVLSKQFRLRQD